MSVKNVSIKTSYGDSANATQIDNDLYIGQSQVPDDLQTTHYNVSVSSEDEAGNSTTLENAYDVVVVPRWITPKTNWSCRYDDKRNYLGDFFEIEDWRRIIGNLYYLKELSFKMYTAFPFHNMDKKEHSDLPYAKTWNDIERNIDFLIKHTYAFKVGKTKTYVAEAPTLNYEDLNRIESACLIIYEGLTGQYNGLRVLSFILGGDNFGN